MGKGRQISAIILNYFCRGKTKVGGWWTRGHGGTWCRHVVCCSYSLQQADCMYAVC